MGAGRAQRDESGSADRLEQTYEILGPLSEGGMGRLVLVRHRVLGEVRVAKRLRAHLGENPRARARFSREAEVASRLRLIGQNTRKPGDCTCLILDHNAQAPFEDLLAMQVPAAIY